MVDTHSMSAGLQALAPGSKPVCMVVDPWDLPYNGTVVSSRRFVEGMCKLGLNFRILSCQLGKGEDLVDEGAGPGISCHGSGRLERYYFPALSLPGVNGIIRSMKVMLGRPDKQLMAQALSGAGLLHVQFPFFLGYSAIAMARKMQLPVICSFHVQPENLLLNLGLNFKWLRELLYKIFIRYIYNRADLVIAPSRFAADQLIKRNLQRPVEVVSNGVPDKFFIPKATPNDSADVADFHILSVGRLSGEKQQSLLIDAIANSRHREKIQLQLVGAGPNEVELNTQITKAGINATVETVSDAELLLRYQLADLFVHCGMIELEGMSVAEAMAASNAVVVSDSEASAAGMFAISESAKFKSGDVNDLTEKLDYWIENPDARIEAGKLNRNFIQGYRHEACIEKLIGLYARFSGEG